MTVVVAVKCDDGGVLLAGDSFCGTTDYIDLVASPKVMAIGDVGLGICGASRPERIIRETMSSLIAEKKEITLDWLSGDLIDEVREALAERGSTRTDEGVSSIPGSSYILAYDGSLLYLDSDFGVWESQRSFGAIGVGYQYAVGAMSSVLALSVSHTGRPPDLTIIPSEEAARAMIHSAMAISSLWSPFVSPPFSIIKIDPVGAE